MSDGKLGIGNFKKNSKKFWIVIILPGVSLAQRWGGITWSSIMDRWNLSVKAYNGILSFCEEEEEEGDEKDHCVLIIICSPKSACSVKNSFLTFSVHWRNLIGHIV